MRKVFAKRKAGSAPGRAVFAVLCCLALLSGAARAGYPGSEEAVVRAVERVEPSVVFINTIMDPSVGTSAKKGMGSGVIISPDGWIVTNAHVTRNAVEIYVTLGDGRTLKAYDWRAEPGEDIAVVRVQAKGLPVPPLGNSDTLKKGQIAVAIGNPLRLASTVTVGCISATGRNLDTVIKSQRVILQNLIQTDAAINPGNSGGALVNSSGQVIGINTLIFTGGEGYLAQGLSFAIPINRAMELARKLTGRKEAGAIKPWLGVTVIQLNADRESPASVQITGFPPGSPAQRSGLLVGDVIISLNGRNITRLEDLLRALQGTKPGEAVPVVVQRGERRLRANVRLEGMRQ